MITLMSPDVESYAQDKTEANEALLDQLIKETYESMDLPQMVTGRIEGRLLRMIAKMISAKRVMDIGMFTGYSALSMASGLPADGEVYSFEVDPKCISFAKSYFERSEHGKKIHVMEGPALDSIKKLSGSFDMVFIDADKVNYWNYYEAALPLLRQGGLIIVDNVLWGGNVLNPKDNTDKAIDQFNQKVSQDSRVEKVFLTIRDGIYLIRKL